MAESFARQTSWKIQLAIEWFALRDPLTETGEAALRVSKIGTAVQLYVESDVRGRRSDPVASCWTGPVGDY
jgi:hypothetical protein